MYSAPYLRPTFKPCRERGIQTKGYTLRKSTKFTRHGRTSPFALLAALGTFLLSSSAAFSVNIFNYTELQNNIGTNQTPLNISAATITWPAVNPTLVVNYSPEFTVDKPILNSNAFFQGQGGGQFFTIAEPNSAKWTGNFTFSSGQGLITQQGGAIGTGTGIMIFDGNTTFSNNITPNLGGGIYNSQGTVSFNTGSTTFELNNASSGGGGLALTGNATGNFNSPVTFSGNSSPTGNGGAIFLSAGSTLTFNGPASFIKNSGLNSGAIFASASTVTFNSSATFSGNRSNFDGPQGIYLANSATLNLNPPPGAVIDIQDGMASDGTANVTNIGGGGTVLMGGNSRRYQGATNVTGGTFQLQPGTIYGNTTSGSVSIGPGGILVFNLAPGNWPLLQGQTISFDGGTALVTGSVSGPGEGTVAQAGEFLVVNRSPAIPGSVLNSGALGAYGWQLVFASPTMLNLIITEKTIPDEGDQTDINLEHVLNTISASVKKPLTLGLLGQYLLGLLRTTNQQEQTARICAITGEPLTGAYTLLLNDLLTFNVRVEERLNSPLAGMKNQERVLLASKDHSLPLAYGSHTPWVGWGQIIGGAGRQRPEKESNAYDSRSGGLVTGFDRTLDPNWRLGAALNLQRGILDWDYHNTETRANTLAAVLYGSYDKNAWFARSLVGGGGSWVKNSREIPLAFIGLPNVTALSNATLPFVNGRVSSGYHFYHNAFRFTPSAGLFYVHMANDPFSESGADELNLHAIRTSQDNLQAQANLEALYVANINDRPVTLRANYGISYETLDKQVTITTGFLAFPNLTTFDALAPSPGRLRQIAEVGMNFEVAKNVQFYLDYIGIFANYLYNNTGALGVKVVF